MPKSWCYTFMINDEEAPAALAQPTSQKLDACIVGAVRMARRKIPTCCGCSATDPERGLLAHQVSAGLGCGIDAAGHQIKGWRALTEMLERRTG